MLRDESGVRPKKRRKSNQDRLANGEFPRKRGSRSIGLALSLNRRKKSRKSGFNGLRFRPCLSFLFGFDVKAISKVMEFGLIVICIRYNIDIF